MTKTKHILNITIAHLNTRSLFTGFNEICKLVSDHSINILAVTETWLNVNIPSHVVNIPGYKFFRKDRLGRGGGVGFYVDKNLNCEVLSVEAQNNSNLEYLWLKIKLFRKNIAIGVLYRPPHTNITDCIETLDNIVPQVLTSNDDVVILGDVNVNMLQLDNVLSEFFETFGFAQVINEPTRVTQQSATLIDPIFVSDINLVVESSTTNADLVSDHKLVICKLHVGYIKYKQKMVTYRDFKSFNHDSFYDDLLNNTWDEILYIQNIDDKIEFLTNNIINLFSIHAPIKTARVNKPHAPWMTSTLKLIFKERDRALRKYERDKNEENWNNYKNLRNYTLASIRREKLAYLNFLQKQKNQKEIWKGLKALNIRFKNDIELPPTLQNPSEINDFFISVFTRNNSTHAADSYKNARFNENLVFKFAPTDIKEINKILSTFKSNASGEDQISLEMIKLCFPVIAPYLVHIFNICLEQGYFPAKWKNALIRPLPKINDPKLLSDLRPISLLPVLSKMLEKVVQLQISAYLSTNMLLPTHQSGFRAGHSTTTALLNLLDNILQARDKKLATVLISLDFSKAFDTIDHKLLCVKLQYYGFDERALSFFNSYLYNRHQRVTVAQQTSTAKLVISGVPQGSILGPLLFLLYTADISNHIQHSHLQSYADDTQMLYSFLPSETQSASHKMNQDLKSVYTYAAAHNLKLNPNKSVAMVISSDNKLINIKNELNIMIDNTTLEFSQESKILGIIFDEKLRFYSHVSKLFQRAYIKLKVLYSNRYIMNYKLRKKLCESLVIPIFHYCDIVYFPCLDVLTQNRIQRVQNICCRFVCNLRKFDHLSDKFTQLKWLKMAEHTNYHYLTFIHRLLLTSTPVYLRQKLITRNSVHNVNTRFHTNFTMPQHSTAFFQRSFSYNAVKLYNSIPENLKSLSLHQFRIAIKNKLLNS